MANGKKEPSSLSHAWLVMYNVAMTAGWLAIGIGMVMHVIKHRTYKGIYTQMQKQLLFFQTCALLEIVHAIFGIVRSNVMLTTIQVFSRVGLLWFVVEPVYQGVHGSLGTIVGTIDLDDEYQSLWLRVRDCEGVVMLMVAWTVTEVVRYCFYTFHLLGSSPYLVLWLRYTLFIILYPLGVMGELLTIYKALPHVAENNIYSLSLPNQANFAFSYYYVLIGLFPVYLAGFPQLYFHMFSQRRKSLSSGDERKKTN